MLNTKNIQVVMTSNMFWHKFPTVHTLVTPAPQAKVTYGPPTNQARWIWKPNGTGWINVVCYLCIFHIRYKTWKNSYHCWGALARQKIHPLSIEIPSYDEVLVDGDLRFMAISYWFWYPHIKFTTGVWSFLTSPGPKSPWPPTTRTTSSGGGGGTAAWARLASTKPSHVSENSGTPNLHPKSWSFLVGKSHGCWGNPPF